LLAGKQRNVKAMSAAEVRELPVAVTVAGPQPRRYLVFAVVSIALFMASVDQTIVATALGTLQSDLHAQVNWSSWTITIYALGQIIAMPLAGKISDQYGRKTVFIAAIVLFTGASLCCGLANDIYVLVALRLVQAIGGGAFMPSATGIVADQFGPDRDRAIGLFTSIFPIGGVVGPVLGGVFVTYWSWRGIFLVNVPIGIVLLCLAVAFIPSSAKVTRTRLDVSGIALLGVGLLGVMLGISYLGSASSSAVRPQFLVPFVAGIGALVLFVRHSARATAPFVPLRLLSGPGFGVMNLINFVWGSAALGFGTLVPLYAAQRYGIATLAAGTLLTARALGMIAVAGLAVFALRRTGYRLPMIVGFVVAAAGLVIMALPAHGMSPYVWLALSAAIMGIGVGVAVPASNNATLQQAPESTAAIAGLRGMFRQSGGITAVSIVTAIMARSSDPGLVQAYALAVLAAVLLCLIPLVFRVPEHRGSW
jgi:EmrB/QacA subfamily drug resistance transporter